MTRSAAQIEYARIVAEHEVMKYKDNYGLWHKYVHGITLDPFQIIKARQMIAKRHTMDFSCRRSGKTYGALMKSLFENATTPYQQVGIACPKLDQSKKALSYHNDAIGRSEILKALIAKGPSGRSMRSETFYQFVNGSGAMCFGIYGQIDGENLTGAHVDEVDDMPEDRLFGRFMPMLAATRGGNTSSQSEDKPWVAITGVKKGGTVLNKLRASGQYTELIAVDRYRAAALGLVHDDYYDRLAKDMAPEDYIRQALCRDVVSKNFIHGSWVKAATDLSLQSGLGPVEPAPGERYKPRGLVAIGYDAGGHGEDEKSSRHALVIAELVGGVLYFPYVKSWEPWSDEMTDVLPELISILSYFRPVAGVGDAYGVAMIAAANDAMYKRGVATIDRRELPDSGSSKSTWPDWWFSPIRFEGDVKHIMAKMLKSYFTGRSTAVVIPHFDQPETDSDLWKDFERFKTHLQNVQELPSKRAYSSYKMVDKARGDDFFDAAMAAVYALISKCMAAGPGVILIGSRDTYPGESYGLSLAHQ